MNGKKKSRFLALITAALAGAALMLAGMAPAAALVPISRSGDTGTINYVNLGDSYSAGFGSGTIKPGPFPDCLQTTGSTHVTMIDALRGVQLIADAACAGLDTAQITATAAAVAPQLAQADLVTLSLGGNNLQWGQTVSACSAQGTAASCQQMLKLGYASMPALRSEVGATLQHIDAATRAKILVVGYPQLFTTSNGDQPLITAKNARALNKLGDALNRNIKMATKGSNASFVSVTGAFKNHGLGAADSWISFNLANPADPFNLHPTSTGYQEGYYPAVKRHINLKKLAHSQEGQNRYSH
ncbi:SGNH/GDSL hydrolase family protein [Glutamicibacter sp. AOP38-B1-38]|uniref:SGNH/GDSL hydrolase family protein n=1 Tax=Glutamicibacter sp. AOP38-B1-38 TaxID=3457680 RepID=UPI0040341168